MKQSIRTPNRPSIHEHRDLRPTSSLRREALARYIRGRILAVPSLVLKLKLRRIGQAAGLRPGNR